MDIKDIQDEKSTNQENPRISEASEVELAERLGLIVNNRRDAPGRQPMLTKRIALDQDLPDETTRDSYAIAPITNFGDSLLKKMGMGKEDVEGPAMQRRPKDVVQYNPRPENLGLGAIPKKELLDKIKKGQDITSRDLRSRMFDNTSGRDRDDGSLKFGDQVRVTEGRYENLEGIVVELDQEDDRYVTVQLSLNQKNVKLHTRGLDKLTPETSRPAAHSQMNTETIEQDIDQDDKQQKKKKLKWVLPNINLRIISKNYRNGKYYEETGYVNDILDKRTFSFVTKNGDILEDLEEKNLETVMPKVGGKVLILKGDHKGVIGILKERSKKENNVLIKIEENQLEFIKMTQDDCSSYRDQF